MQPDSKKGCFLQNRDKNLASSPVAEAVFQVFQDKSGNSGRVYEQTERTCSGFVMKC